MFVGPSLSVKMVRDFFVAFWETKPTHHLTHLLTHYVVV